MADELTIALAKGRILDETLPLLQRAGIEPADDLSSSRRLVFATNHADVKLVLSRTSIPSRSNFWERISAASLSSRARN